MRPPAPCTAASPQSALVRVEGGGDGVDLQRRRERAADDAPAEQLAERTRLLRLIGRDLTERKAQPARLHVLQRTDVCTGSERRKLATELEDRLVRVEAAPGIREVDVARVRRSLSRTLDEGGEADVVTLVVDHQRLYGAFRR